MNICSSPPLIHPLHLPLPHSSLHVLSTSSPIFLFLEMGFLSGTWPTWLVSPRAPPVSSSVAWDNSRVSPQPTFMWVLLSELRSSCLHKNFINRPFSPSSPEQLPVCRIKIVPILHLDCWTEAPSTHTCPWEHCIEWPCSQKAYLWAIIKRVHLLNLWPVPFVSVQWYLYVEELYGLSK